MEQSARAKPLNELTRKALVRGVAIWKDQLDYATAAAKHVSGAKAVDERMQAHHLEDAATMTRCIEWLESKLASVEG